LKNDLILLKLYEAVEVRGEDDGGQHDEEAAQEVEGDETSKL